MKKLIVIDFDGVIFNMPKFKEDYIRIFGDFGINKKLYQKIYKSSKKEARGNFDPRIMFKFAKKEKPVLDVSKLRKKTEKLIKNSRNYIYKDAADFLKFLKSKKGVKTSLLSKGVNFQKAKIKASGVKKFLDKVVVTSDELKTDSLRKIIKSGKHQEVIFIDDTAEIIDDIKEKLPFVFTIQIAREKSVLRSRTADLILNNLTSISHKLAWHK